MLTREQVLTLIDESQAALKGLRRRLEPATCEPPAAVVAAAVVGLAAVKGKLGKLDLAVQDAAGEGGRRDA